MNLSSTSMLIASPAQLLKILCTFAPELTVCQSLTPEKPQPDVDSYVGIFDNFSLYFIAQQRFESLIKKPYPIQWVASIDDKSMQQLFEWVEYILNHSEQYPEQLMVAVEDWFLLHIAYTEAGEYARKFMGPKALAIFMQQHQGFQSAAN